MVLDRVAATSLAVVLALASARPAPHILLFVADDTGLADVSYMATGRAPDISTPAIDRFAHEGVRLSNYYVQPVFGLYLNETLLAEAVQSQVAPAAVGKMHIGASDWGMVPQSRGFEQAPVYFLSGEEDYYEHTTDGGGFSGVDFRNGTAPFRAPKQEYAAYLYSQGAEQAITAHKQRGDSRPLFLYYASQDCHAPLQAPPGYANASIGQKERREYSGMVRMLDEQFANVTRALDAAGYLNDTIIVFTNENPAPTPFTGANATFTAIGGSNWPWRGSKHTLWGKGFGFVWGKAMPAAGGETGALLHAVDVFQVVVAAAGMAHRSSRFPLDAAANASRVWETIAEGLSSRGAVRNETLLNYDPLATPGPKGCCGYAGLVWVDDGDATSRQWKLLVDGGEPNGWYPPGSGNSVPPTEAGLRHVDRLLSKRSLAEAERSRLESLRGRIRSSSCPSLARLSDPSQQRLLSVGRRSYESCADSELERLARVHEALNDSSPVSPALGGDEWFAAVDRKCNPRRQLQPWELLHRERSIQWGRLAREWIDAQQSNSSSSAPRDSVLVLGNRTVQLFEVSSDPYELCDVARDNPDVVARLLARLDVYIAQSLPDGHGAVDPRSNPAHFDGFWTPWLGTPPDSL